ncbi:aminoglycoside 6'-N-acetyltransferase [Kitasatospora gansuensis]|uniref:Aminoglycoside 6'-N-acetyltransferase n=1 Tax=Kitasatospora gansuensis TaxID=258050 RepID=A0A7W7S5Z7_9ACTN|nr:GNAT family N-acetyltransferase [Kitasatospora gansuensis]MBB4944484.1 aminoglycoside 6'-N-acetyltransferase [Kitasatospora gansuensis]MBB4951848.1 aminoglycoside 6'-N-acetyltransferase [Kitasatospora gansuensis]MBB4951865.1 aminoglycoside 6'-N-acetyltransferase [Kitasatospora gansuensis]
MTITWRRVGEPDFPQLRQWLLQPHVARWWNHDTSPEAIARHFAPAVRGEEPSEDFLVALDGAPVALVQRCRLADYPQYLGELASQTEIPDQAITLDYLIGDPRLTGQGLGTRIIEAIITATWTDHPDAQSIVIPVHRANRASWRMLEKAGLHRCAEASLEPDNPADDRLHFIYRTDRPTH